MRVWVLVVALALGACREDAVAENVSVPDLNVMSEIPGDWSDLRLMVGRTPAESGLFEESPITVDLNALVGPEIANYRRAMAAAGALRQEGPVLVAIGQERDAYVVLYPQDHALEAGLRKRGVWLTFRTAGAQVPLPPSVGELLAD